MLGTLHQWGFICSLICCTYQSIGSALNVIVGNTLAGIIGVACAQWIPDLTTAFSVAVGFAIFLMMTTDSLHPPSGAVAITAVLGGAAIHKLGFYFVFIRFCSIHYFYSVLLYF